MLSAINEHSTCSEISMCSVFTKVYTHVALGKVTVRYPGNLHKSPYALQNTFSPGNFFPHLSSCSQLRPMYSITPGKEGLVRSATGCVAFIQPRHCYHLFFFFFSENFHFHSKDWFFFTSTCSIFIPMPQSLLWRLLMKPRLPECPRSRREPVASAKQPAHGGRALIPGLAALASFRYQPSCTTARKTPHLCVLPFLRQLGHRLGIRPLENGLLLILSSSTSRTP